MRSSPGIVRRFGQIKSLILAAVFASIFVAVWFALATPGRATAQRSQRQDEFERELEYRRKKELNKRRQQDIQRDTGKLVQLTTELKGLAVKNDESLFSADAERKTEQVEKLARKIKDNMKEVMSPPEPITPSPSPRFPR